MWSQVQKMLQPAAATHNGASPPVIPLRKSAAALEGLAVGKTIRFAKQCPLPPLGGAIATIVAVRLYRFGLDIMKSYQLQIGSAKHYFLTVAEDDQGQYLGISRSLDEQEQDSWFGRDALSFFTEPSSAKSIRCKADLMEEGEWAGARYSKTVDWIEGTVAPAESPRLARTFHYNLLVNEAGDKALEIEHDDASEENRVFITTYRPVEDIAGIEDAKAPEPEIKPTPEVKPTPTITIATPAEVPLFKEPALSSAQPKQRQDFRRLQDDPEVQIHIERTPLSLVPETEIESDLPAFLLSREDDYLSLDNVLPPEAERVRVSTVAARNLIDFSLRKNLRVRDVLRSMIGLESALSEEVIFEMPLTDEDYETLAMRYKLRPDHRVEIRSRLEEELREKLLGLSKA